MSDLGQFALLLGLFLSSYAVLIDLLGSWRKDSGFIKSGRNATVACLACLTVAMVALWILLIGSDFSVDYVAQHTSKTLPLAYKISALWAGAAGSLLLWLWIQVGFIVLVYCKSEFKQRRFSADARVLANLVSVFFLIILVFDRNPFAASSVVHLDGSGLNPLLQHPAMVLHPPILFIGYAGFLVPLAWAFGWLKANPREGLGPLFNKARHWTLLAWFFLTGGIALGAWWAYEELGWGGYWAWDPVENASLFPWLTSTALLHCFRTYKARSSTATWAVVLSIVTFSLCVFGRFLTKYGLVSSVHGFNDPGLGILYIVLLCHIGFIAGILMVRNHLKNKQEPPELAVKSNKFIILNNWLFVFLTGVIFVGTLFPFLSKLAIGIGGYLFPNAKLPANPISLAPEFFTKITAPGGLTLLLLIALCPFLLRNGLKKHWRTVLAAGATIASIIVWLLTCSMEAPFPSKISKIVGWIVQWLLSGSAAIPCFILCGLILVNLVADFVRYEKKIAAGRKTGRAAARNLKWYGARIVHLGVVMIFIGIAGSEGFDSEDIVAIRPGDRVQVPLRKESETGEEKAYKPKYELTFEGLSAEHGANFTSVTAHVSVYRGDTLIAKLKPAKSVYSSRRGESYSEIDVRRTLAGDLYLAMTEFDNTQNLINLRILIKPLINWIWIGSCVMLLGAMAILFSPYWRKITALQGNGKDAL